MEHPAKLICRTAKELGLSYKPVRAEGKRVDILDFALASIGIGIVGDKWTLTGDSGEYLEPNSEFTQGSLKASVKLDLTGIAFSDSVPRSLVNQVIDSVNSIAAAGKEYAKL